jgi:hypothetical protein
VNKLTIYLSHPISGGGTDNLIIQKKNCKKAIEFGEWFRKTWPEVHLYIPAESEPFVGNAYKYNFLTISQILDIDCLILADCNGILAFCPNGKESAGMSYEIDFAERVKIPVLKLTQHHLKNKPLLRYCIGNWLDFLKGIK